MRFRDESLPFFAMFKFLLCFHSKLWKFTELILSETGLIQNWFSETALISSNVFHVLWISAEKRQFSETALLCADCLWDFNPSRSQNFRLNKSRHNQEEFFQFLHQNKQVIKLAQKHGCSQKMVPYALFYFPSLYFITVYNNSKL